METYHSHKDIVHLLENCAFTLSSAATAPLASDGTLPRSNADAYISRKAHASAISHVIAHMSRDFQMHLSEQRKWERRVLARAEASLKAMGDSFNARPRSKPKVLPISLFAQQSATAASAATAPASGGTPVINSVVLHEGTQLNNDCFNVHLDTPGGTLPAARTGHRTANHVRSAALRAVSDCDSLDGDNQLTSDSLTENVPVCRMPIVAASDKLQPHAMPQKISFSQVGGDSLVTGDLHATGSVKMSGLAVLTEPTCTVKRVLGSSDYSSLVIPATQDSGDARVCAPLGGLKRPREVRPSALSRSSPLPPACEDEHVRVSRVPPQKEFAEENGLKHNSGLRLPLTGSDIKPRVPEAHRSTSNAAPTYETGLCENAHESPPNALCAPLSPVRPPPSTQQKGPLSYSTDPTVLRAQLERERQAEKSSTSLQILEDKLNTLQAMSMELRGLHSNEEAWSSHVAERQILLTTLLMERSEARHLLNDIRVALSTAKKAVAVPDEIVFAASSRQEGKSGRLQQIRVRTLEDLGLIDSKGKKVTHSQIVGPAVSASEPKQTRRTAASLGIDLSVTRARRKGDTERREFLSSTRHGGDVHRSSADGVISGRRSIASGLPGGELAQEGRVANSYRSALVVSDSVKKKVVSALERYRRIGRGIMASVSKEERRAGGRSAASWSSLANDDEAVRLAVLRECEVELAELMRRREAIKSDLTNSERFLFHLQGQIDSLQSNEAGESRRIAEEHADLLDKDSHNGQGSLPFNRGSDLVGSDGFMSIRNTFAFGHEKATGSTQCDLITSDTPRPTSATVTRFERVFKGERALVDAVRSLSVSVAHSLYLHWTLQSEGTCKACLQPFEDPFTIWPCGHTVCGGCIGRTPSLGDDILRCSECGSIAEGDPTPHVAMHGIAAHQRDTPFPIDDHPYEINVYTSILEMLALTGEKAEVSLW